ncbi:MAG: hypothetical protein LBG74_04500 [Spirochaetaceae bacterium]|nr:hypothetical protein [Spirochaetaceae bacterium]
MYQIEMWGADGGTGGGTAGGTGGYVTGKIVLDPDARIAPGSLKIQPIYIYVGGAGGSVNSGYDGGAGGWNGGGAGGGSGNKGGAGGGGATSISLVKGAWNDLDVLANRIMVAGGGGGAGTQGRGTGAQQVSGITQPGVAGSPGGGVAGSAARTQATNANTPANSYGGTYSMKWYGTFENYYTDAQRQVALTVPNTFAPGQEPSIPADISFGFNGQGFGIGGNGRPGDAPNKQYGDGQNGKGGGGGGWWGGRVSMYSGDSYGYGAAAGGGGGSSYVSGFDFCKSLTLAVVDPSTFETSFTSTQVGQPYNGGQGQPSLRSPQVGEVRFGAIAMNDWVRPPAQPATPIQYDALDTLAGINSGSAVPPNPVVVSSGPKNGYVKIKLLSDSVSSIATWRN